VNEFRVLGITTNLSLFSELMADPNWIAGDLHTGFLEEFMRRRPRQNEASDNILAAVLAAAAHNAKAAPVAANAEAATSSAWLTQARAGLLR
jgi:acetyl-CoA carboxylase biotin carboxylase subunit